MLIFISNHHHHHPSPLVCPFRAVERRKKVCKRFTIDFSPFLTCFFINIGDFLLIYANSAGFRAPPPIEGCGLHFEGVGRMWEGTRTIGETRAKGDPAGASTFRDFYFATAELIFCNYRYFKSRRNILLRRPHPLSLPTTTQAGETNRFAAHIHPHLRPRLPFMRLREFVSSSACVRWGDTIWWVVRRGEWRS